MVTVIEVIKLVKHRLKLALLLGLMLLIRLVRLLMLKLLLKLKLRHQLETHHPPFLPILLTIINQVLLTYLRQLFLLETLMLN